MTENGGDERAAGEAPTPDREPRVADQTPPAPAEKPPRQATPPSKDTARKNLASVYNNFNGPVYAPRSAFGLSESEADSAAERRAAIGSLTDVDINAAIGRHVRPAPFDGAATALAHNRLVVLTGMPGTGKRTSGIALLREVTSGPLAVLSPASTLKDLAEQPYEKGHGYLVADRFDERLGEKVTDFIWRTVRDRVSDAEAYMVVTASAAPRGRAPESVRHIAWERPEPDAVLRAYITDQVRADQVQAVQEETIVDAAGKVPPECAVADIVAMARLIGQGRDIESAAREVLDLAGQQQVRDWFESGRTRREVTEITALAFLLGTSERTLETLLAGLQTELAASWPVPTPAPPATAAPAVPAEETVLEPLRGLRVTPDGLTVVDDGAGEAVPRRMLTFREDGYRIQVLDELWSRYPSQFWDAVRAWLDDVVEGGGPQRPIAEGLALLARGGFDEVESSYLERWSDGHLGWSGQSAATYVLWCMCLDETLAPLALWTATRWVSYGTPDQRWTGATAFTGELGLRYPTDAVRRLWQLVVQPNDLSDVALVALARLFATLTDRGEDAGVVVGHLQAEVDGTRPVGKTRRRHSLALLSAVSVLSVRDARGGVPAVAAFLHEHPDWMPPIAGLWAAALRNRPCRRLALTALWDALDAFSRVSHEPERPVRALGDALVGVLSVDEQARLWTYFTNRSERLRRGHPFSDTLLRILLAVLNPDRRRDQEGSR